MRLRKTAGVSLIEILVVIVVFLVGILALVQVFPPGLIALRTTANSLVATALGENEAERLSSKRYGIPDYISTVEHVQTASGLGVIVRGDRPTRELMAPRDPSPNPGLIDINGNVLLNSGALVLGDWTRVSGPNRISRVMGESHQIGAPRSVGGIYGSMVNLTFAPIYYYLLPSGVGEPGVLQVYGNEMARRMGDRKTANPIPASFGNARDWEFFFVHRERTDPLGPFFGLDQIWLGPATTKDVRIAMSFVYDADLNPATAPEQYDTVLVVSLDPTNIPPYATIVDNFWVVSLPDLVGQPDIHGRTIYSPMNVTGVHRDSVRCQRLFQEIPVTAAFDPANPYQYKALNGVLGTLLVNPIAFDYEVRSESGRSMPLVATTDYTVYDWRILRDEFRAPTLPSDVKLVMSGLKPRNRPGPDGRLFTGFGFDVPTLNSAAALTVRGDDFTLMDIETGAVILGNMGDANNPNAGYHVDKTNGYIQFRDIDAATPGMQVPVAFATGDPLNPWVTAIDDISGHAVRALYHARGEWAVQVYRSAARYRTTDLVGANGLQVSEVYVGGTRAAGSDQRLYFPLSDLGQRVNVGEFWYRDGGGNLRSVRDQNLLISGVENLLGIDHAYADIGALTGGGRFDTASTMGYIVSRVRGASMTIRVMNNPAQFNLDPDAATNYLRLEEWSRNWRRHETESYVLGGGS
jgi:hypothetical protein